jgi:rod shape determining protein RodA
MSNRTSNAQGIRIDWVLLVLVLMIATVGLVDLRSAAEVDGIPHHVSQTLWLVLGSITAAFIASQDYRLAERAAYVVYALSMILLVLVPIIGTTNNTTAQRWIDLGVFQLQPSEPAKIAVILVVARYLHDNQGNDSHGFKQLLSLGALVGLPFLLVLIQPDLGTALTIALIACTIAAMERFRITTLLPAFAAGIAAVPLMWIFVMKEYQKNRVLSFLNPGENLHGHGWQVSQSRIAIGSGQFFGKGFLRDTQVQNGFVPEHENDFVFTHHGEQFGFLGSVALIGLYAFLILWALRIAAGGKDRFAVLTSVGVAAFLFWHVTINLGMVMGVLPVVGLWLPLASYGGSAMITVMMLVGILMSISIRRDRRY